MAEDSKFIPIQQRKYAKRNSLVYRTWKTQQRRRERQPWNGYYFYFDPVRWGRRDMVSGTKLNTLKPAPSYTEGKDGSIVEVPADVATVNPFYGMRNNAGYTNILTNSEDLRELQSKNIRIEKENNYQKITVVNDGFDNHYIREPLSFADIKTFTTSFKIKKGSCNEIYFRGLTEGFLTNVLILDLNNETVTGATNDYLSYSLEKISDEYIFSASFSGDGVYNQIGLGTHEDIVDSTATFGDTVYIRNFICSETPYSMPYIPTKGSPVSSPDEYASATTGSSFELANIPKALEAFQGKPSRLDMTVYNGYELFDTGNPSNILNPNDGNTFLKFDGFKTVSLTDGTNTVSQNFASIVKGFKIITALWDSSEMQLIVDGVATAKTSFTGSFNPGMSLNFFWNNPELWYFNKPTIRPLKSTDWVA